MSRQYGALSGMAITLIVLNHAITLGLNSAVQNGFPLADGWLHDLLTLLQIAGIYAVPTFLFISGSFLNYAAKGRSGLSIKFIYGGLRHIIWPYLIWSIAFYLLVYLLYDEKYSILGYLKNLIVGYPFHFVPLIIFWYLLSPLLVRAARKHGLLLLLVIGIYQLILIIIREQDLLNIVLPGWTDFVVPPVLFNSMADWAIYLPLGVVLGMHSGAVGPWLLKLKWPLLVTAVILFIPGVLRSFDIFTMPLIRYFAPLPLIFLLPIIQRNSIPLIRSYERIGRRAYGTYLMHLIVIELTLVLIQQLVPQFFRYWLLLIILLFIVGLGVPIWLMEIAARGPTRRYYRYVFG